jgi:hypothetical protein
MSKKATIDHIEIPKISLEQNSTFTGDGAIKDGFKMAESFNLTIKDMDRIQKKRWEDIIDTIDTEKNGIITKKEFIQSLV